MSTHTSHPHTEFAGPLALFTSAWALFVKHWQFLVPLFIIPTILIYIGNILQMNGNAGIAILSLLFIMAGVILSVAQRASAINVIHKFATNSHANLSLKEEYRIGFTFFWPMVWVTLLISLLFFGTVIFLIFPAIILGIYTMFYTFILVLEGKRGMSTFIESYQLVRGRWIEVLGRLLFLALATVAAFLVLAGVVFLAKLAFVMVPDSLGLNLLTMAFNLALTAIVGPVTVAYLYFLYEELKKTRTHHAAPASIRKWLVALSIFGAIVITALPFIVVLLVYALK